MKSISCPSALVLPPPLLLTFLLSADWFTTEPVPPKKVHNTSTVLPTYRICPYLPPSPSHPIYPHIILIRARLVASNLLSCYRFLFHTLLSSTPALTYFLLTYLPYVVRIRFF
ncbi:hypothetical protein C8F04DRAFT_731725 [Mycena alexandri]|uniref:Secreted protein n=1 Tax=Mycena alexandri TaxID=1745969 RepID=A0AAD6SMM9_9AGAR|nr:hypothetical protein C8F04DRAFT_731725 [Mycena alexandri]